MKSCGEQGGALAYGMEENTHEDSNQEVLQSYGKISDVVCLLVVEEGKSHGVEGCEKVYREKSVSRYWAENTFY